MACSKRRLDVPAALIAFAWMVVAAPVQADGAAADGYVSRHVEMPLHTRLSALRSRPGVELAAFASDGCSGGMSSLWTFIAERFPTFADVHAGVPPWEACCVAHDRAYHAGGTNPDPEASFAARFEADAALRQCVVATSDERHPVLQQAYGIDAADIHRLYEAIAAAMFHAVRLGGQPCTGLPWRWGYGYPKCDAVSPD